MSNGVMLSPSALEIYSILLRNDGKKMEKGEILRKTRYSTRSFYYAVDRLKKEKLIKVLPDIYDMRKTFYRIL